MTPSFARPAEVAIVTLCSTPRLEHLRRQLSVLSRRAAPHVHSIVVWVGDDAPPALEGAEVLHLPPGPHGLRLAAGRNRGFERAVERGSELIVGLDADCVPGPRLIERYVDAAAAKPSAVLSGPVTYLPPGAAVLDDEALDASTAPHPARPAPPDGHLVTAGADQYPLFWSLSFAVTTERWSTLPGFDERFEGYGGEDTDFAFALRDRDIPLVWVGGADAYHQHHPTSTPPWQHLDDILRNGALFAEKWGEWPMSGWLSAFEAAGAIRRDADGWAKI